MEPAMDHHEYCTGGFDPGDIVISGIAGRFPECDTVGELKEGLYNKKNLIVFSDARFEKGVDALDLKGQRIGIFSAAVQDDSNKICASEEKFLNLTCMKSMNPNKTSYSLGFTGPSICVDTACSSSGAALWSAVQSMRTGCVEAAVVSGCQLHLIPGSHREYLELGIISPSGSPRPYDSKADGLMTAESVCAIFLQKAKVARRAYATVKASRFYSAGYGLEGSIFRDTTIFDSSIRSSKKDSQNLSTANSCGSKNFYLSATFAAEEL
ncbi:unnamed protein product [Larinioides sclopetarius]|uniref:Ketosynthase family 3 (KS3) domain-containing protein n=1 Tax=Larinioides sclopetarius TaxID=280406 RepID=A0AAV2AKF3_9ARAC